MRYLSDHINYKDGFNLWVENVRVQDIPLKTPFYCYSHEAIIDNYKRISDCLPNVLVCYAVKANPNLSVIRTLAQQGAGADIVSEGEMRRALKAGMKKIIFSGVGKTKQEIEFALQNSVYQINAESIPELDLINQISAKFKIKAPVGIRLNLDVEGNTHDKISTCRKEDKFGISYQDLEAALDKKRDSLNIISLSIHIGSQITDVTVFDQALSKLQEILGAIEFKGHKITRLDLGGGFSIPYTISDDFFDYYEYAQILSKLSDNYQLIIEPGRALVGNAGVLVTQVLFIKNNTHIIVDAGMNDMMRPALYDSYHEIIPVHKCSNEFDTIDVVGPVCESSDTFAKARRMPHVKSGELLAICTVGAYGASMSNNYNSRLLIPEVMVCGDKHLLIRKRSSYDEMLVQDQLIIE